MSTNKDTFCILPWIHMYVNPDGNVLPCCIGDWKRPLGNTRVNSIEEIWNSEAYKRLRLALLNGEQPPECNACWVHEKANIESNRIDKTKRFKGYEHLRTDTKEDGSLDVMKLLYFDVRWSNICNFKCRTCSATYSSSWAMEDNANGKKVPIYQFAGGDSNNNLFEQFKPYLKDIQDYYFAGGEPLITDKHYDILDHLIAEDKTDAMLEYNTNLSNLNYKKKSITEYWNNFKRVVVRASIDHYGERGEYIREGTDWKTIEQNLEKVKQECPHVTISFNTVVSAFNILTLTDFLTYMRDKGFDVESSTLYNIVDPKHYSLAVLSPELLHIAKYKLEEYLTQVKTKDHSDAIKGVISTIDQTEFDIEQWKIFTEKNKHFDAIRKRDFLKTFPELM